MQDITKKVEEIKPGEFVRRKAGAKATYIRGEYCRFSKRYTLQDFEDINRFVYVKKGTALHVEFEF